MWPRARWGVTLKTWRLVQRMHAVWLGGPPLLPFLLAQPGVQPAGKKSAVSSERLGTPRQTPHTDTIGSPSRHALLRSTVLKWSPLAAKSGPCCQNFQSALFELLLDVNHKTRNARHFRKCINIKEIQISQQGKSTRQKKDKSYSREIFFKSFFCILKEILEDIILIYKNRMPRERSRNVVFIETERIHWVANIRSAEIASSSRNSKPSWNFRTPGIKRSSKFIERTQNNIKLLWYSGCRRRWRNISKTQREHGFKLQLNTQWRRGSEGEASACNAGDRIRSLSREDPLEKEMAPHSSTLAWKIPWTEEPGRLQSMGSQRVGHDWATSLT